MRAEELIAIANVHGIDLRDAARRGSNERRGNTKIRFRQGTRFVSLLEPSRNQVKGTATRSVEQPAWTVAELGQAAAGVPETQFRAARYAFAGDMTSQPHLRRALHAEAEKLAQWHKWPARVKDIHGIEVPYLEHMAKLVLDHDAHPMQFIVCDALYWIYLNVTEATWDRQLAQVFVAVQSVWFEWLGKAMRIMQPRLRNDDT